MNCRLVGLPKLGNKILIKSFTHGGQIIKTVFELPENMVSALEWIDFIVPKPFKKYVSSVEKIVLDDFFGFRPKPYGMITLYSNENPIEVDDEVVIWTSESQPIHYSIESDEGCIIDFLYSYSEYNPSKYRPEYIHPDMKYYDAKYIAYFNVLSHVEKVNYLPRDSTESYEYVVYPPNILGGRVDYNLFYPEFHESFEPISRDDQYIKWYLDILSRFRGGSTHIFPLIFNEGLSFEGGFITVDGDAKYIPDVTLDLGDLEIDLTARSSSRYTLSFKRFRSVLDIGGRRFYINIGFQEFSPPPSHLFIEFRIGSKIVWSSDSKYGLKPILIPL